MQNLNKLFNLVKQAAPIDRGSQLHQDLVGQLNNGQITQELFDNSMQGYTPVTRGSQQHQDLVGKLNNSEITLGQFNGAMQGRPITPIDRGSQEHQDLVGRLNGGQINQDQFNSAMLGGRKLKERNFFNTDSTLKQRNFGMRPQWPTPITFNPYWESPFSNSPFNTPKFMRPETIGIATNPFGYTNPQDYKLPEDIERRIRQAQTLAGGWEILENYNPLKSVLGTPVTPGSQLHQDLVKQLDNGQITKELFNDSMGGVKSQTTPQPAPQPAPLSTPQQTPTPLPAPQPAAQQPSTPSVGSAIGKSTYNPANITRQMMNKYRKYTSARNMNSDMDRWKTWQAMQGNRNASNADYYAAKKNNFM